ncbi:MAG: geranylgeranyl reductase family protein [bacterium]
MEEYEVIVIGGGPGGAVCARELARRGRHVLLIERGEPDRYKPCAGGISPRTALITPMAPEVAERTVSSSLLVSPKGLQLRLELGGSVGWVAYRHRYDGYLCRLAEDAGAEVRYRCEARSVETGRTGATVHVRTPGGEGVLGARCIVGAFGYTRAGRLLGQLGVSPPPPIVCVCIEAALDEEQVDDRIGGCLESYFDARIVRDGYAWIFPRRAGVNVGLATRSPSGGGSLRNKLTDFIANHPVASAKLKGWEPKFGSAAASTFGHLIPGAPAGRVSGERFVLVGDASGAADPLTGEGIYHAQRSGQIAAEVLSGMLKEDRLSADDLTVYDDAWRERLYVHGTRYSRLVCRAFANFRHQNDFVEVFLALAERDENLRRTILAVFSGVGSARETFRKVVTAGNFAFAVRRLGWKTLPLVWAAAKTWRERDREDADRERRRAAPRC